MISPDDYGGREPIGYPRTEKERKTEVWILGTITVLGVVGYFGYIVWWATDGFTLIGYF